LDVIQQLEDVEFRWADLLQNGEKEASKAQKSGVEMDDDPAYQHCVGLLEEEFQAEEQRFGKIRRKLKVSLQSVDEHLELCGR
jgi:hypothetical protein